MIENEVLRQRVEELAGYMVECRRAIHRRPEISGQERETKAFIRREIDKLGLPVEDAAHTAQVVTLDTGRPGPHVLLRADIDALPIGENPLNLKGPRQVISEIPGMMHACGHDGHTAMLLGAMRVLHSLKDRFDGLIYLVFEEGEENGGSVNQILKVLEKYRIDTCWGIHLIPNIDSGKMSVEAGPRMAGVAPIEAVVHGKGGHGSRPDLADNPVFAAAAMYVNTAAAFVNQLDVNETVTLGLTRINGGAALNTFPDTAVIGGTLRFFNPDEGQRAVDILKKVFVNTAEMNNCRVEFLRAHIEAEATINDPERVNLALEALGELFPPETFVSFPKMYCTESMSKYLKKYPGVFTFLGTKNEALGTGSDIHTDCFDVDENVLPLGALATVKYALASLAQGK
jgi:amidohydrolase